MPFINREARAFRIRSIAQEGIKEYYLRRCQDIFFNFATVPEILLEDRDFMLAAVQQRGSCLLVRWLVLCFIAQVDFFGGLDRPRRLQCTCYIS
eukprot:4865471-Amphidinium_carterae.1